MNDVISRYRARRLRRLKARFDEEDWVTIKGTHVLIDEEGNVTGGPQNIRKIQFKNARPSARLKRQAQQQQGASAVKSVVRERVKEDTPPFMREQDSKKSKKVWNKMQEYVNGKEDADSTCVNAFSAISNMEVLSDGYGGTAPSKVSYIAPESTRKTASFCWREMAGKTFASELNLEDSTKYGEESIATNIHEMTHMADHFTTDDGKYLSSNCLSERMSLPDGQSFFARENHGLPEEVMEMARKHKEFLSEGAERYHKDFNKERSEIIAKYGEQTYDCLTEINAANDRLYKKYLLDVRVNWRNENLGWGNMFDIYDALSGGRLMSNHVISTGHGYKYYSQSPDAEKNRRTELLANYVSIGICSPKLLGILRKDQPELCKELDSVVEEMTRRLKK